jgi:hypothetical protein
MRPVDMRRTIGGGRASNDAPLGADDAPLGADIETEGGVESRREEDLDVVGASWSPLAQAQAAGARAPGQAG